MGEGLTPFILCLSDPRSLDERKSNNHPNRICYTIAKQRRNFTPGDPEVGGQGETRAGVIERLREKIVFNYQRITKTKMRHSNSSAELSCD
jgi:hypothetical protein